MLRSMFWKAMKLLSPIAELIFRWVLVFMFLLSMTHSIRILSRALYLLLFVYTRGLQTCKLRRSGPNLWNIIHSVLEIRNNLVCCFSWAEWTALQPMRMMKEWSSTRKLSHLLLVNISGLRYLNFVCREYLLTLKISFRVYYASWW